MALFEEAFICEYEVISWADKKILEESEPFNFIYLLSIKGSNYCKSLSALDFPKSKKLTYSEKFSLRVDGLDLNSKEDCKNFRLWVSSESLGEDLMIPEVMFGYHIDEDFYCTDNRESGLIYFKKELPKLIILTKHLSENLWHKIA